MVPTALTIAGSDPSGGAGIQADLKTFHQRGVYGMAAITLLTVQNTCGVRAVRIMDAALVRAQVNAVLSDIMPAAVKTGALGNAAVIRAVARELCGRPFPVVIDPVMISKHGSPLLKRDAVRALLKQLFPLATLVTPNVPEAEALSGVRIRRIPDMKKAARRILASGARAVLIKGGHLKGAAMDFFFDGRKSVFLKAARVRTRHTHGTGCTYAAAVTAELAKGKKLLAAVRTAKKFITRAILTAPGLGRGRGPVNHFTEI